MTRIYLSPPEVGAEERRMLLEAFDSNWIAPVGPDIDAFERELADRVGVDHAVALTSGTAALHLGLQLVGVGPGDEVLIPSFTFVATAAAVTYLGAHPVFVDCSSANWNIDPELVAQELAARAEQDRLPAAVVTVDLYGQTADYDTLTALCDRYGIPLIEDAAEALGALLPRPTGRIIRPRRGLLLQREQDHHHQWRGHAGLRLGRADRPGPLSGHPGPRPLPPLRAFRPRVQLPAEQSAGRPGTGPARRPRQPDRAAPQDQRVLPFGVRGGGGHPADADRRLR